MKLTSYNIAVKALNAKCCLSDIVTRMWGYMQEGDVDKAHCAREKAVLLTGLIETLERWMPIIPEGKTITYITNIVSGNYTFPYVINEATASGIKIINQSFVYGSDNSDVLRAISNSINGFIGTDDDIIKVTTSVTPTSITSVFKYIESMSPLNVSTIDFSQNVTVSVVVSDETTFTQTPYCLTNEQILSVVKKIDEICECGC